jgi:hypothetical protein
VAHRYETAWAVPRRRSRAFIIYAVVVCVVNGAALGAIFWLGL